MFCSDIYCNYIYIVSAWDTVFSDVTWVHKPWKFDHYVKRNIVIKHILLILILIMILALTFFTVLHFLTCFPITYSWKA